MEPIGIVLADDNLIVREGVRTLLDHDPEVEVLGLAGDYDELVETAIRCTPQVVITDIRMPPNFQNEGIEAAKEIRRRLPGTGIVILSQYDDPEYAVALLSEGAAGFAYLLKDRVADGGRLSMAVRAVATGGSMLDPEIAANLVSPMHLKGELSEAEERLLSAIAHGRPIKAIAASRDVPPEVVNNEIEALFLQLAKDASAGQSGALKRLRVLQKAIVDREEQGETLSRLLPGGLAEKLRSEGATAGQMETVVVTVLMSDIRGYSGIAEHTEPAALAGQLNAHRKEMNAAVLEQGGCLMQYVGDAVLAVFGAPVAQDDHAAHALAAAISMHERQARLDKEWAAQSLEPFGLGIGVSTGEVAAALLGSDERLEYTVIGDTVNLAQRLQDLARPAGTTIASGSTVDQAPGWNFESLPDQLVKGRQTPVRASRVIGPSPVGGTS